MGNSQGKFSPSPLPPAPGGTDLQEGSQGKPGRSPCRRFYTGWPLWAARARGTTPRSHRHHPATAHRRLGKAPPRRLSRVLQTFRSFLGNLGITSTLHLPGLLKNMLLSAAASTDSCSSDHPCSTQLPSTAQEQDVAPCQLAAPQEPCPGKTVITAPGDGGLVVTEQAEAPPDTHQRACPQVTRGAQSTFRPLVAPSCRPALVPRPGALQGNLCTQSSRATCMSSCTKRNPISSSYSSTRGLQALKRRAPGPSNGARPLGCSSSPGIPPKKANTEKVAGGRAGQPLQGMKSSSSGDTSRPRKRKFPLLPHRRGEPLRLPPPLDLAYPVTAEDLDQEKRKALQRINCLLMGETPAIRASSTMAPQAHARAPSPPAGARPLASVGLGQTLPHHPSSPTMVASTPAWVGSAVCSQSHSPTSNLRVPLFPSLPMPAVALPPRPSPSTLAGLAPQPVPPFGATLMNTIMPSQPPHLGPPSTSGGSFLPSNQGPKPPSTHRASPADSSSRPARRVRQRAPHGKQPLIPGATVPPVPGGPDGKKPRVPSLASCQHLAHVGAPGAGVTLMPPLTGGPTTLGSLNNSALGADKHRNTTVGAPASTQTHSVTSMPAGRADLSLGRTSPMEVTITCPQTRAHQGVSLGNNTYTGPGQSTSMAPRKHSKKGKHGQGDTGGPALSAIPQSLPTQKHLSSPWGTSTRPRKAASHLVPVPVTSRAHGSPDLLPELISAFGALCISSQRGGTPSSSQQHGARLAQNTSSTPGQSPTVGTQGRKARRTPGQGTASVPRVTASPQSLPSRKTLSSPGRTGPTPRKSTCKPSIRSGSPDLLPDLIAAFGAMAISTSAAKQSARKR